MFKITRNDHSLTLTKDKFYIGKDGTNFSDLKTIIRTHVNSVLDKHNIKNNNVFFRSLVYSDNILMQFKPKDYEILKKRDDIINDLIDIEYMVPVIKNSLIELSVVKEMDSEDFKTKKHNILKYLSSKGLVCDVDYIITNVKRSYSSKTIIALKYFGPESSFFMLKF